MTTSVAEQSFAQGAPERMLEKMLTEDQLLVAGVSVAVTSDLRFETQTSLRLPDDLGGEAGVVVSLPRQVLSNARDIAEARLATTRSVHPVHVIPGSILPPESQDRVTLALTDPDFALPAELQVLTSRAANLDLFRDVGVERFLPASRLDVDLKGIGVSPVTVSLPPHATGEYALLVLEVDLSPRLDALSEGLEEVAVTYKAAEEEQLPATAQTILLSELNEARVILGTLCKWLEESRSVVDASSLSDSSDSSTWKNIERCALDDSTARLKSLASKLHMTVDNVDEATVGEVKKALGMSPAIAILVDPETVDVQPPKADHVRMRSITIPYTTEREAGTHGKRSAASLLTLGALLALVSTIDLSWLAFWDSPLPGVPGWLSRGGSYDQPAYSSALVALLLVFPAALYAQFFQNRPRSDLGNSAQLGLFGLLSAVFTVPTVPAALVALGQPLGWVSIACLGSAVLACATGGYVLYTYSPGRLDDLRARFAATDLEMLQRDPAS